MPSIPMLFRASLTSSSLNGWMTASIFFMFYYSPAVASSSILRFYDVSFFAMQADVQPFHLLFLADAHSYYSVANFENNQRAGDGQPPSHTATDELIDDLGSVAVHQAERQQPAGAIFESVVDGVGGEHAGEDGAQRSSDAVHAESVQGVIVLELLFHLGHHEEAHDARGKPDRQRRKRPHKTRRRRDGHQSGHASRDSAQHAGLAVV